METQAYYDAIKQVAELVDQKQDFPAAVVILQTIIQSDLPDLDRSIMCVNMAVVCDKMGHDDHALAWYDHGIALEAPYMRDFVAAKKAEYLAAKGRNAEAIAIYQQMLNQPFHTTPEREQMKAAVAGLRA